MIKFKYGTTNSGKSAEVLLKWWKNKDFLKVCLLKPSIDSRNGKYIYTRFGDQKVECNMINENDGIYNILQSIDDGIPARQYDLVIIDEAQFLTNDQLNQIYEISSNVDSITFLLYGLKTDFKGQLFSGTKRIFEIADEISEIGPVKCWCGVNAKQNARIDIDGNIITDGDIISIGYNYIPLCNKHFYLKNSGKTTN